MTEAAAEVLCVRQQCVSVCVCVGFKRAVSVSVSTCECGLLNELHAGELLPFDGPLGLAHYPLGVFPA